MKDWKGNTIEIGHTVYRVATINPHAGFRLRFIGIQDGEETDIVDMGVIEKDSFFVWEEYLIIPHSDIIEEWRGNELFKVPINYIEKEIVCKENQILCIKGISDNQFDYYKSIKERQ